MFSLVRINELSGFLGFKGNWPFWASIILDLFSWVSIFFFPCFSWGGILFGGFAHGFSLQIMECISSLYSLNCCVNEREIRNGKFPLCFYIIVC